MDSPGFGKSNSESAASAGSHSGQEEELWLIPKPGSKLLLPHLKTVEPLTSSSISLSQLQPSTTTTTKGEEGYEQDYAAAAAAKVADAAAAECEDKADNDDSNSSENEVVSSSSPEHQETSSLTSKKVLTIRLLHFSFTNLGASLQQLYSNIFKRNEHF